MPTTIVRMYKEAKATWNPAVGCWNDCVYCVPSFQRQAKRQKSRCLKCYNYEPHLHPERLAVPLPKTKEGEFIFVCDMGDWEHFLYDWKIAIIRRMAQLPDRTFLIQSKNPESFFLYEFPPNVILGTTIETNRSTERVSKAPPTEYRYITLVEVKHPRKAVTHEPIMDFDLETLVEWDKEIKPEIVWIGYANRYYELDEPEADKTRWLGMKLSHFTKVIFKTLREPVKSKGDAGR